MPPMRAQASAVYIGVITMVASTGPLIVSTCTCNMPVHVTYRYTCD